VHPYTKALLAAVPFPSLDQRLDLTALMEGRASIVRAAADDADDLLRDCRHPATGAASARDVQEKAKT
jgi:hypothetical protein